MKVLGVVLIAGMCGSALAAAPKEFSANAFGAVGDGKTLATVGIQRAIDAAGKRGGVVTLKPGVYLSGSIFVKTNVTLRLDAGVTILGSQKIEDYPMMPTRVAGIEMTWPAALVNVYEQTNAAVTGAGTIDGDGMIFWKSYWDLRKEYEPRGLRWASDYDARRPRLVQVYKSSHVTVGGGLMLRRSGFWTVHLCYSTDVHVDGVTIRNNEDGKGPSTDGIDIDSSSKVLVEHVDIAVNDDALCLKAGRDSDGLRVNRPTTDVVIRDAVVRAGAAGVTIGSETSGGFKNIEAYRITVMAGVSNGILFKSAHVRGGTAEDIRIHDITVGAVAMVVRMTMNWNPAYSYAVIPAGVTGYPEYWTTLTTHMDAVKGLPHFKNVKIWNVTAVGAKAGFDVSAYKDAPLEDFRLEHFDLQVGTAGSIANALRWEFLDVKVRSADGSVVKVSDSDGVMGLE